MPRFDRGVVNTKLEKGDIVLMGNPTQYGEILAENILVEDILKADLETLISGSNLVRGKFYRITNAVSSTLSLLVQGLTANTICDYAYNTANGDLVTYNISTDLAGVPFSSVYVPYTGATADVNLGEYQIKVGQLELDQTPTGTFGVGKIRWNDTDGTPEVMLKGANVTLQIGQEQLARVVNKTNTNLTEAGYQVVRISGAQGQRLKVGLAQANSTTTCKDTLGLVTENISNNAEGFITTSGLVRNINTTGSLQGETWADGDRIYLSPSVAGGITNVEPSAPNIVIVLGYVVYAHATQGSIYVSVEGAKALHELFDVSIPTPTNNNVLVYESSTGLWKDKSISTILGFTPIANNATVGGELSGTLPNPSLVTSAVTGKALTGLSVSGSAVVSTDSILTGIGKLQNQINAVVGSVNFQGVWNASTNSPSLASGVGTKGYYYVVSVAGSTNLDGITDWKLGDWAIYDGTAWQKVDNTDAVVSVNGYTGIVTLAAADVGALPTSAISGTTGKLAKFTASGAIGNSIVSESGGVISVAGALNITSTAPYVELTDSTNGVVHYLEGNDTSLVLYSDFGNTQLGSLIDFKVDGNTTRMSLSATELITFGATDTGEAHIFGGSARVNGNTTIIGSSTWNPVDNALETLRIYRGNTAPFLAQSTFIDTSGGNTNIRNNSTDSARTINLSFSTDGTSNYTTKFSLSNTELITFGATDTGEAHIFGGSARVNGTLGVGVTTSSWGAGYQVIQVSNTSLFGSSSLDLNLGSNMYLDNVGYKYISNGFASLYNQYQGKHYWSTAASGTAGNAITFTQAMTLDASGNLGIGTTSPLAPLHIKGNGSDSYNSTFITTNSYTALSSGSLIRIGHTATSGNVIGIIENLTDGGTVSGTLALSPNGTRVLIGTTTDDGVNKLQVSGSVGANKGIFYGSTGETLTIQGVAGEWAERITGSSSSGNSYGLLIAAGTNSSDFALNVFNQNISTSLFNIKGTGAATFSSSVTAGGSVGVGGTNTDSLLTINGTAGTSQARFREGSTTVGFVGGANGIITGHNGKLALRAEAGLVLSGQGNAADFIITSTGKINMPSLPTSSAGLSAGDIWNDGGTLKIV